MTFFSLKFAINPSYFESLKVIFGLLEIFQINFQLKDTKFAHKIMLEKLKLKRAIKANFATLSNY